MTDEKEQQVLYMTKFSEKIKSTIMVTTLIDISHSICVSGVNEVGDLFDLDAEMERKIICYHSDVSSDIWVIGTDYMSPNGAKPQNLQLYP